jgi:hypothetical protein
MAKDFNPRNISPFLQALRNFLLGREHVPERAALRYAPLISKRDQPPPIFPPGEAHQIANNPYCKRDGRRLVTPPEPIVENTTQRLLTAGSDGKMEVAKKSVQPKLPGKIYLWD